ncbi:accessory gene regulator ArgB-like protein [Paenibacillus sp. GCM10012307]|uniref:Accessory gene regulator B family protein n=1 Tax=Paenibacillus roseus TaxID=2798579 RepID=A0A934MWN3_9BACL|nr:accessory gene regulator B family protein [Paenibacillus roseus]MBJ6363327.1 accessory gene regulator B family protein [Paenibacillus roseus]
MLEAFSRQLAGTIKQALPDHPVSEAVLRYGLNIVFNTVCTIVLSMILGIAAGRLPETMVVLFGFALLRVLSGGYHFKSGLLCVVVSSIVAVSLSFVVLDAYTLFTLNAINAVLVVIYAPSGIERQTRIPKRCFPMLKIAALLIVLTNLHIHSSLLAVSWFVQAISLVPVKQWKEVKTNEQKSA